MNFRTLAVILVAGLAQAQSGAPEFRADRVLAGSRAIPLVPGLLVSIYGANLTSQPGCTGQPDPVKREAPSPLRPDQSLVETQVFPKELCGVQVLLGDRLCGLLYVSPGQINFKVPQESPMEATAPLRVVAQGRSSAAVEIRLGIDPATIALAEPAHAGGPVWIHIEGPSFPYSGDVHYPVRTEPADFGCNEFEVRRNGTLLTRLPMRQMGTIRSGSPCGYIGIPGHEIGHPGRLPLHLQYSFDQPGPYEVRYARRRNPVGMTFDDVLFQTAWTRIEILPAVTAAPLTPPADPAELIADYLPNILGFPDEAHLKLVSEFLYDPNPTIRRYVAQSLGYWPLDQVNPRLAELLRTRGPSDALVDATFRIPGAVDQMLPALRSDNHVLVAGAVLGVTRLLNADPPVLSDQARARAEDALIAASGNVLLVGDLQTVTNYAGALGAVRDPRGRDLLWDFVKRNVAAEQSLMAITWLKNSADLPRLATLLEVAAPADTQLRTYAMLPYAIRRAYGDAALPVLESALRKSGYTWVRVNCAEELVEAGRKPGFAFMAQAIEQNQSYRRQIVQFIKDRFPELRTADDGKVLDFVKARQ